MGSEMCIRDRNTTGAITFNGALTASTLNTAAQAYSVALNATTGTITNAVTFSNTGTVTLGASTGTLAFTGGITATAPSAINVAGTITAATTAALNLGAPVNVTANTTIGGTSTGNITLGAATLVDGATLTVGTGIANAISLSLSLIHI